VSAIFSKNKEDEESIPDTLLELEEPLSVAFRFVPQDAFIGEGCVRATTLFECIITESEVSEAPKPVARFACALTATYNLHDGYVPTEAEIAAFHKANVIFNCWPYFREFIQSSACRMNIPPPPVPFVRVQVTRESATSPAHSARKIAKKKLGATPM
jgi:hypothetical protein